MNENSVFKDNKIIETGDLEILSDHIDWGLIDLCIPDFWKKNKGEDITVLVADTGITPHTDLNDNILWDKAVSFIEGEDINDLDGHGTMVAGIISAKDSNYGIVGVAPNSKIIPVKIFKNGKIGSLRAVEDMLKYAYKIKPNIINLSFGSRNKLSPRCEFYIKKLVKELNIPVICAMGNYKDNYACFPAEYEETFAVTSYNKERLISEFSSRSINADFALPGENILTTTLNNKYVIANGTSFAAPFLSGIIALLLSQSTKSNIDLSVKMIKALLMHSSTDYGPNGHDKLYGYGILNSKTLLNFLNFDVFNYN